MPLKDQLKKNWFILAIIASFILGLSLPGVEVRINPGGTSKSWMVYALLFLSGLSIPTERILEDLREYRLHLFIQGVIFLVYPLLTWVLLRPLTAAIHPHIRIGILALACLPSTVSSCIVFSQLSGGNLTAAVFNAAVSNILSVFITPLLFTILVPGAEGVSGAVSAGEVYLKLIRIILLPILAGQLVRIPFRKLITRWKKALGLASNLIIFFLIYFAVARSAEAIITSASFSLFALPVLFLLILHLLMLFGLYYSGLLFGFDERNRLTALFVGSHKTLALGLPLTAAVFGSSSPEYGFIILPLIFYYNIQLISSGIIRSHIAPRLFSCSDPPD
jgi:solute carrier family 10 (sodium/bile acid cotransporter), member 7